MEKIILIPIIKYYNKNISKSYEQHKFIINGKYKYTERK